MANQDKPLSSLIADLSRETSTLVRDEVQLAKAELNQKIDQVTNGAIAVITGAFVVLAGLLSLLYAAIVVLADLLSPLTTEPWVSPLIIGVVLALVGFLILRSGRKRLSSEGLKPKRTLGSLRRNREILRG